MSWLFDIFDMSWLFDIFDMPRHYCAVSANATVAADTMTAETFTSTSHCNLPGCHCPSPPAGALVDTRRLRGMALATRPPPPLAVVGPLISRRLSGVT